ncbi:MAG TPA: tetratricopeptide repeat protein, partial [Polyangia bacterium]
SLTAWSGVAVADDRDVAREAFREGTRQFDLGDFKSALAAFKKAYLAHEDSAYLYNIAQCQRQLGDKADALRSYRVFLLKEPNSPERPQIERIIAELQAAIEHDKTASSQPPTGVVGPRSNGAEPAEHAAKDADAAHASAGADAAAGAGAPATALVASAPPRPRPLTKKPWFWATLAGGAVVIAGAVTLGVVLGTRHSNALVLEY